MTSANYFTAEFDSAGWGMYHRKHSLTIVARSRAEATRIIVSYAKHNEYSLRKETIVLSRCVAPRSGIICRPSEVR